MLEGDGIAHTLPAGPPIANQIAEEMTSAFRHYVGDVKGKSFPSPTESY